MHLGDPLQRHTVANSGVQTKFRALFSDLAGMWGSLHRHTCTYTQTHNLEPSLASPRLYYLPTLPRGKSTNTISLLSYLLDSSQNALRP